MLKDIVTIQIAFKEVNVLLPKNHSHNGKNKSGHDTLGIVLIIVFSFLLLCSITGSLILGDIGLVVKNISIGLLGYFAYPIFLYCIIRGIFLLQNKELSVRLRNLISIIAIFLCAGIIVHLATTSSYIGEFGSYMNRVFHSSTVGGVFMGLFAYVLNVCLTSVGAYILLGCVIVVLLLLVAGFFDKGLPARKSAKKHNDSSSMPKIKAGTSFVGNGGDLFIESIVPNDTAMASPGSFDELPDETEKYVERRTYSPGEEYYSPEIQKMRKQQDERFDEIYKRSRAHNILFGNDNAAQNEQNGYGYSSGGSQSGGSQYGSYNSGSYHNSQDSSKGWDDLIVIPPPKNISSRFVSGSIINGDAIGPVKRQDNPAPVNDDRQSDDRHFDFNQLKKSVYEEVYGTYADERKQYSDNAKNSRPDIKIVPPEDNEDLYTLPDPVQPMAPPANENRPPIINGDSIEEEEPETPDFIPYDNNKEQKEEKKRPPIIIGSSIMADEPYVNNETELPAKPNVNPAPIIRASHFEEDLAAGKKQMQAEKQRDIAAENPKSSSAQQPSTAENAAKPAETAAQTKKDLPAKEESEHTAENIAESRVDAAANQKESAAATPDIKKQEASVLPDESESADYLPPAQNIVNNAAEDIAFENSVNKSEDDDVAASESKPLAAELDTFDHDDNAAGDEYEDDYAEIHGHPKFVDVTQEEAEKLSDKFDKTTKSFSIFDEVIDASENVKLAENSSKPQAAVVEKAAEKPKEEGKKPKKPYKYTPPSLDLLTTESTIPKINPETYEEKKSLLEETLENLGIPAKVLGITVGPTVTRYELNMPTGMSVKKIENCEQDIRYGLACKGKIRIESPIPGKKAVGIEVPNDENALVALKDIVDSKEFKSSTSPLTIALGKDIQGRVMISRIDKMPHLLIAGTTGSGKSACLNSLIISLLYKSSPEDVKLILVDPKRVEFTAYSGLPHMMIPDAITEAPQAINAFKWAREEMERRYKLLQANRVRNISEYNNLEEVKNRSLEKMPYIVVIVDEFADLMIGSGNEKKRELENLISSIAGKARAAGIHLILATQRPSAEVITGTIKSNLPCRISFAVSNQTNSRIILDKVGAESLLGKGDMLYAPQENPDGIRIQGAFINTEEVINIVEQIKANNQSDFNEEFEKALVEQKEENNDTDDPDNDNLSDAGYDKDLPDIVRMVIKTGQASGAMIQRRFSIGYMRAAKIVDQMEKFNFIGPHNGSKPREVYISKEKFKEFFGEDFDED